MPVMVARDAPISTLNPDTVGVFQADAPFVAAVSEEELDRVIPQVVGSDARDLVLMAVRPAWVRVRAADGTVIHEKILNPGEEYLLPKSEEAPTLTAGGCGAVYF